MFNDTSVGNTVQRVNIIKVYVVIYRGGIGREQQQHSNHTRERHDVTLVTSAASVTSFRDVMVLRCRLLV